jgi:hypothetical protein
MISVNPDYNPLNRELRQEIGSGLATAVHKPIPEGWQKLFATSDPNKHIDSLDQQDRLMFHLRVELDSAKEQIHHYPVKRG